jgi:L-asparagine transporter-like permease
MLCMLGTMFGFTVAQKWFNRVNRVAIGWITNQEKLNKVAQYLIFSWVLSDCLVVDILITNLYGIKVYKRREFRPALVFSQSRIASCVFLQKNSTFERWSEGAHVAFGR